MAKSKTISLKSVKLSVEAYRSTICVLMSFLHLVAWDEKKFRKGANFTVGRKMRTSDHNRISKNNDVTPDLVIQLNERDGYICEAKTSLPQDASLWTEEVHQLQKYDDTLLGWWTADEKLALSNLILLIEISQSKDFSDFVSSIEKKIGAVFNSPTAFIEYVRANGVEETIFFRLHRGELTNDELCKKLSSGLKIPIEDIMITCGQMKFYDQQPQPEYLMEIMWTNIFNNMKLEVPYNEKRKAWIIKVNVQNITLMLQKSYGRQGQKREQSFPQIKWVRKALDHFVAMKYGEKIDIDNYHIYYKSIHTDLLDKFYTSRKYMKILDDKKKQFPLKFQSVS